MALFYEDLVEPTIVKQVRRQIAYCRCIRSKNLRFCDGSHAATNISPRVLEFNEPRLLLFAAVGDQKTIPIATAHTAG